MNVNLQKNQKTKDILEMAGFLKLKRKKPILTARALISRKYKRF